MKIKDIFPKAPRPIFSDLKENSGQYWRKIDKIVLDFALKESLPGYVRFVYLHEMIHATAHESRLNRVERLTMMFGNYVPGSKAWRIEECIAEIAGMVCAMKLEQLNQYSINVFLDGVKKNYGDDIYIPWREVTAAVRYFARDDEDFTHELSYIKDYVQIFCNIKVEDTYLRSA